MPAHVVGQWQKLRADLRGKKVEEKDERRRTGLTSAGLALNHEPEQTSALAALGGDVWKGKDSDVVPPMADLLPCMRRVIRV